MKLDFLSLSVFRSSGDDDDKTRDKERRCGGGGLIRAGSSVPVPGCESCWRKMGLFPIDDGNPPPPVRRTELLQGSRAAGKCNRPSWKRGGVTESSSHSLAESRNHPMAGSPVARLPRGSRQSGLFSLSVEVAEEIPFQVFPLRTRLFGHVKESPLSSARVKPVPESEHLVER